MCNAGAIAQYARVSRTRTWSWRHSRRRDFYPDLKLDPRSVCFNPHHLEFSEVVNVFKRLETLFFALCLGLRDVEINTKTRAIIATGEIGTITTETMPGFGAVVTPGRLQVSSPWPQHLIVEHSHYEVLLNRGQLLGSFILGGSF